MAYPTSLYCAHGVRKKGRLGSTRLEFLSYGQMSDLGKGVSRSSVQDAIVKCAGKFMEPGFDYATELEGKDFLRTRK